MNNSGDTNLENFQSLVANYEAVIKDVTNELDSVHVEHSGIKIALKENSHLSAELNRVLAERANCQIDHTFQEGHLIENLKLQLKTAIEEKECAIKLWQNAAETVDGLEGELRVYQDNTEGLIPKSKLLQLKHSYEEKLNNLQETVIQTKTKLEETLNLKSKELQIKDKEITGTLQSQDHTFKIIKNLEDEVLKLQQRLNQVNKDNAHLERAIKSKNEEIEALQLKIKECMRKVEEAVQVVEAAFNEKDAALLRETETRGEILQMSKTLTQVIDATEDKIKAIENGYEEQLKAVRDDLIEIQEQLKARNLDMVNYSKKCASLEQEIERLQKNHVQLNDTSKLIMLEKNLETTFQKLLLAEKQNIQLKSEKENIKMDMDQMAQFYERDVNSREVERGILKNEVKKLKNELDESRLKTSKTVEMLNERISTMDISFKEKLESAKSSRQQTCEERDEREKSYGQLIEELQEQLISQVEINKKWRTETKSITEQLGSRINELKTALNKNRYENRSLSDKLKEANLKMCEYRKFLEMISQDVNKITNITLFEPDELNR